MSNAATDVADGKWLGGESRCYASFLGDCEGKLSQEHTVSKAVLKEIGSGDGIVVSGAAWIPPGETRKLLPNALTSRVLCERHNSALHRYDDAGNAAIVAIREAIRRARDNELATFTARIDPELFAGWCLKVLCGQAASGQLGTAKGEKVAVSVRREWVEVLFGRKARPSEWKLMLAAETAPSMVVEGGGVSVGYIHSKRSEDGGACEVVIQGIRFMLFLARAPTTFEGAKLEEFPLAITLIPANGGEGKTVDFGGSSSGRVVAYRLSAA